MKHAKRILTKKPMDHVVFRLKPGLKELMRAAAAREEISQSDFVRNAIESRAAKILGASKNG